MALDPIILRVHEHFCGFKTLGAAEQARWPEAFERLREKAAGLLEEHWQGSQLAADDEADDSKSPEGCAGTLIFRVERLESDPASAPASELKLHVKTGYCVGVFWVVPGVLALRIEPKLNRDDAVVDMSAMLQTVIADDGNDELLSGLLEVDFDAPLVPVDEPDNGLRLFLAAAYVSMMSRILEAGLMRGFRMVEERFRGKVKGKILLAKTLRDPAALAMSASGAVGGGSSALLAGVHCRHQVFDFDTTENRLLKAGLRRAAALLADYAALSHGAQTGSDLAALSARAARLLRRMAEVSDADELTIRETPGESAGKLRSGHPLFGLYRAALETAEQLRRLETLGFPEETDSQLQGVPKRPVGLAVPPHSIDMPKLFELYAGTKLREALEGGRVECQFPAWHQLV